MATSACDSQRPKASISTTSVDEGSSRASPHELYCARGHADSTLNNIFGYFQAQNLCDVTLIAGGYRIPAHKVLLASCSKYFAAMFTGSLKEAQLAEITLERVDSQALKALVHYCYTGYIELRDETVEELLSTANLLQLEFVTNACCSYMEKQLNPSNCLGIALFAEHHACSDLHKAALKYTHQNFMQVVYHQEFLALQADELASLLKSDQLNVGSEQNVFESLMTWVRHDSAVRQQHLATLLKLVKLHLLPSEYLINNVEQACGNVPECHSMIKDTMKWHLLPERQRPTRLARPRNSTIGRLYAIGGTDTDEGTFNIEMYSAESNSWCPVKVGRCAARRYFGGAVMQNKFIVVGGMDKSKILNTALCIELTTKMDGSCRTLVGSWSALAPMSAARREPAVAVLGAGPRAAVYAVGGFGGGADLNSVERWDACSGTWALVAPMAVARSYCGAAALGGRLYAAGGWNSGGCLRSVEHYDPGANCWAACAPMARRRAGLTVCADGGYLYALGGREGHGGSPLASVERYDPAADAWVLLAALSCAREGIASCLLADRIVAVGGTDDRNRLGVVEVYDSESNCWQKLAPLKNPRAYAAVVYVPPGPDAPHANS